MSQISELEWSEWSRCLAGHVKFNTGKKQNNCSIMNLSTCRDRRVLREDGAVKRFHYIIKMLKLFFSSKSQRISKMFSPLYLCFYERNLMRVSQGAPLQLSALRRTKMPTSSGLCHAEEWTHLAQAGIPKFAQYTAFISFCGSTQLNTWKNCSSVHIRFIKIYFLSTGVYISIIKPKWAAVMLYSHWYRGYLQIFSDVVSADVALSTAGITVLLCCAS